MILKQGKLSTEHRLAEIWNAEFIDAPYKLGGLSREEGYDCVSLTYALLCHLGADIKPYWGDIDITNYWIDYNLELISEWVKTLGQEITVEFRQGGDILLCHLPNGQWFSSVYLGSEHCAIVNGDIGKVGVCPFRLLQPHLIEVRRCLP